MTRAHNKEDSDDIRNNGRSRKKRKIRGAEWHLGFSYGRGCRFGISERLLHFYARSAIPRAVGEKCMTGITQDIAP